jgi:GNAT superfamily N-acetyltransferase
MGHQILGISIRPMVAADAHRAASLVRHVFNEHVAPLYMAEGINEFQAYASPEAFQARLGARLSAFVAEDPSGEIVGLVEIRDSSHLSLLFVSSLLQGRGIGAALVQKAVELCREATPPCAAVSVNASPNSVQAYKHFGFLPAGPEQERDGIRFVPMEMTLSALERPNNSRGCVKSRGGGDSSHSACPDSR